MTTAMRNNTAAALVSGLLIAGWVASVVIRALQGTEVKMEAEVPVVAMAAGLVYTKMSGRGGGAGPDEGANA
jgi:hypothetical protein